MHIGATALHYGQACFEGLKAFAHKDGSVHVFRPDQNAARMKASGERTLMPVPDPDLFKQACKLAIKDNMAYVPPYGSNGSLYLRPLLIGTGPRIGLQPSDEYTFLVMVLPVGDYYKGGLAPVDGTVVTQYDRAAPRGVGSVKVAGNYAADLLPNMEGKKAGYPILLYLDSTTQSKIEEFSTSNFIGIHYDKTGGNKHTYVTPKSTSVLPSITNKSLQQIAKDLGMDVQHREVDVAELQDFDEVIACGTAVVVTPIGSMTLNGEKFTYGDGKSVGDVTMALYNRMRDIQFGEIEDSHGWLEQVC
jgi:branched-chain amino acid aminotransferase